MKPDAAIAALRRAIESNDDGHLVGTPRVSAALDQFGYVFTAGGVRGGATGFRAYRSDPGSDRLAEGRMRSSHSGEQFVAVWGDDGTIRGIVTGGVLAALRTGALGGLAVDALAPRSAAVLGLVGSGTQAWAQLWAIAGVRDLHEVRVFSSQPAHREAFANRAVSELALSARASGSAEEAVSGAHIVVLATNSSRPVIEEGWVSPGAHVNTIGPKWSTAHETPLGLVERAALFVSDSPEQADLYPWPFFADSARLRDLCAVIRGELQGRQNPDDITLYCSTGLAGTEVVLAAQLLDDPTQ
ncbi:MAG: ornithine cyclodeaminase family protein [Acidimicrobiales bacterium]